MKNLTNKVAAVFAASGEIAGVVAKAFAQHGAKVYVSARKAEAAMALADEINQQGGQAEAAAVDALNENEVDKHLAHIAQTNGSLDVVFNGIGLNIAEIGGGLPTTQLPLEHFLKTFEVHCGSQFLTSRLAAKHMIACQAGGTILTLTAALSRLKLPFTSGSTAACCAIEGLTRVMAAEFGKHDIKVICLNVAALQETRRIKEVNLWNGRMLGMEAADVATRSTQFNLLKTGVTLQHVGEVAACLASDYGVTFNSHIVDVDCGRSNVI
ncbi:SDR family NAD(P)-dependent oxidoreductase [Chryseolinea lacunae]|uniref:SDR family oxidoreductase n=1 Tax=Chryseolinea lacunae TaxID=2801331 RepID=A0ABS1KLW4_9BACT|nr:SDR family oxidoreductase [Chryseolinea lacunae]MBL0740459.1 SDR family oxidoreductase [Chryseolinea lacunae]